ncbi:MAG: gliding motility-associated C-terminal domain-containing protein, partial [Bacteroidota bacterium]
PTADSGSPPLLTCAEDTITIGGVSTSQGPAYIYEWTTTGGNIIGPNDGPFATVDLAAQYQLIVQDTFSFCRDTAVINVTADQVDPAVLIEPAFTLNCLVTADTLDGSASLQAGFVGQWTGPCIIEEPAPGLAIVDCPAWYFLEVTNTATGCSAIDSVLVDEDLLPATAIIDPADTLTCAQPEVILDGSASTPPGLLDFSWLGPNNETGTANTLAVTAGGEYELIVTRQDNFCQDTTTVTVFQDTLHPIADTGPGFNLTCTQDSVVLRGPNTSTGPDFSYNWFVNGNLITDENTDSLLVTAAATYTIEVIDNSNGCSATDMVIITEDFVPPEDVEAGPNQLLSCGGDIVILSPDSTLFSRPVSWEWTADCIEPYSDTWALATDCAGLYTLTVTNLDNGCSGSDTTRVNVTPNFSQAVLPDTAFLSCVDGTAILDNTGSIGTLFNWFRDGLSITLPNNQPSVDAPGIYTLITSDLSLSCADTAQINVVFDCAPLAIINTPDTLTCAQQSIILQSSDSQTVGPNNYRWEGPDPSCFVSPTDLPTAEVVCPGTYRLIIEHALFGEADTTQTIVLIDTIAPQVDAGENVQLTCTNPTANLNGTVLNPGAPLTFAWTNFVPGDTLAETQAFSTQAAGTYRFFARNSNNGCVGSDIVQVTLNNTTPTIAFGSSVYPCEADSFLLEAFISPEAAYEYAWTGPAIQTLTDSAAVWITGPGMYTLSVLNTETGCDALDSILVIEQTCVPCLELPQMDTLDCQITSLELDATFCRPCVDCTLQWSDESGQIPGEESLSLNVTSPGIYILTATDTLGFTSSVSTTVILLDDPPMLDLGPDLILTCDSTTVTIANQIANTPDQPLGYQWSELVLGVLPETGPSLEVSEIGTYVLELTDMISGCSITDTLEVLDDRQDPTAEAGPDQVLTCQSSVVILDGSGSTLSGVSFAWTGPNDACLTGADSNSPLATCPGLYTLEVTNLSNGCSAQDIVRVTINEDVPEVQAFPDTTLTCNIQELLLSSTPPDGGNFTTSWCPLDEMGDEISVACALGQTDTLVNLPGQYRFTVVNDDTGCANSFVVTVGIDTIPPIINAGMNDTLGCNDNSIQLNAQVPANVTLNWTGPMGATILNPDTSTPTVDAVGWYFLAATSTANGCVAIDSVQILVDASTPILDAGVDTLLNCANTSIRLNASGDTFNGDPIWQWDTDTGMILADADQPTPLVGDAAFYFVTLTDSGNGCSIQDTVFVDADFRRPDALLVEPDSLLLTCAQDTLLLDASPSLSATGEAITYSWEATPPGNLFPDLSAPTVFTDRTGNYRLIVQDEGNGCRDTLAFFVDVDFQAPELVIANPAPLDCANMSTLLSTSTPADSTGFTFEWSDEQDQIISANATAEATSPGFYNLLLTDEANGCTSTATVEVLINDELPSVIIAVPPALTCEQSSVILDGSMSSQGSNYTYQWSSLDGTLLGNGLAAIDSTSMPGSYVLVVTDTTTGCTNDESVVVSQEGQPILGLEVAAQGPPCVGGTFGSISVDEVVGGTPPFNYALNNGIMGPFSFFDDLLPGSYELQVQDANGCSWTETIILSEALDLEVDLGPDLEVELGDSIQLKPLTNRPISSWQWTSDFFSTNAPFEPVVTPTETQFVLLTVFDDNNCTATDTIRIFVDTDRDVFIPTAFSPDGIGENERFTIYAGDEVVIIQSLRIFSRWGNMVFEQENFSPNDPNLGWDGTLWGEPLNAAVFVYYAEILFTDGKSELITGDVVLLR